MTALIERLVAHKVREIKLFYILTGHEGEEDVAELRRRMGHGQMRDGSV